jgi:hypothetical protein
MAIHLCVRVLVSVYTYVCVYCGCCAVHSFGLSFAIFVCVHCCQSSSSSTFLVPPRSASFPSFSLSLFLSWSLSALLLLLVLISLAHIAVISLYQRRMVGGGGVGLKEAVESGGVQSPQELPSTTLSPRPPWSTLPPPLHLPSLYAVHDSLLSVVAAVS